MDSNDLNQLATILRQISAAFATPYEKNFHPKNALEFSAEYWFIPVILVIVYLGFNYFGTEAMKSRDAFDLRTTLAVWNAFLSLFSFIGMFRTVPFLLATVISKPFAETICTSPLDSTSLLYFEK